MIKKLTKNDDLKTVANLIYVTDPFLFPFLFGKNKQAALTKIEKLISLENNFFSYQNTVAYLENNKIAGICIFYESGQKNKQKLERNIFKVFNWYQVPVFIFKTVFFLSFIETEGSSDSLYIQNLSVDKNFRGMGVGSKLINFVFEQAQKLEYKNVCLDVATDNPRAKKLYERMGFISKHKKTIPLTQDGVYYMCKKLTL